MFQTAILARGHNLISHLVTDGLTRLRGTRFVIRSVRGTARTLAATLSDGSEIVISPKLAQTPPDVFEGVLMHELGHAVDFLYPAQITLGRGKARGDLIVHEAEPMRRALAAWKRRDHDTVERFADGIAERAFGVTISYRGPCLLQSTQSGIRPRPRGLR